MTVATLIQDVESCKGGGGGRMAGKSKGKMKGGKMKGGKMKGGFGKKLFMKGKKVKGVKSVRSDMRQPFVARQSYPTTTQVVERIRYIETPVYVSRPAPETIIWKERAYPRRARHHVIEDDDHDRDYGPRFIAADTGSSDIRPELVRRRPDHTANANDDVWQEYQSRKKAHIMSDRHYSERHPMPLYEQQRPAYERPIRSTHSDRVYQ